jgi:transcriptional pleiotropic regulator of transition state genes
LNYHKSNVKGGKKQMRATGVVRSFDSVGRLVIPKEIRDLLDLHGASMEFFVEGDSIVIRKYESDCVFCGGMDDLKPFGGKLVCSKCRQAMAKGLSS